MSSPSLNPVSMVKYQLGLVQTTAVDGKEVETEFYKEAVDINRNGTIEDEEKLDTNQNQRIEDFEVWAFFFRNLDSFKREDAIAILLKAATQNNDLQLQALSIAALKRLGLKGEQIDLIIRAKNVLANIMLLKPGQKALILYDQPKKDLGEAFVAAARALGAEVTDYPLTEKRFEGGVVDDIVAKIGTVGYAACVNIFEGRQEEVKYRLAILSAQEKGGIPTAHSPGLTTEMLFLPVDYATMKTSRDKLLHALQGAERARVTSALGTNIEIRFSKERTWFDDVTFDSSPSINIPNGEVYGGPLEDGANGRIVVDGSLGDFGLVSSPIVVEVKNGKIVEKDGVLVGVRWLDPNFEDKTNFLSRLRHELKTDAMASTIGELGFGLASYPLTGEMLQDEKAASTTHIAFGNNEGEGGANTSEGHIDCIVKNPTVEVFYPQASGKPSQVVLLNGVLNL